VGKITTNESFNIAFKIYITKQASISVEILKQCVVYILNAKGPNVFYQMPIRLKLSVNLFLMTRRTTSPSFIVPNLKKFVLFFSKSANKK